MHCHASYFYNLFRTKNEEFTGTSIAVHKTTWAIFSRILRPNKNHMFNYNRSLNQTNEISVVFHHVWNEPNWTDRISVVSRPSSLARLNAYFPIGRKIRNRNIARVDTLLRTFWIILMSAVQCKNLVFWFWRRRVYFLFGDFLSIYLSETKAIYVQCRLLICQLK